MRRRRVPLKLLPRDRLRLAHRLHRTVQPPVDALREQELAELESLRAKLLGVLIGAHPLVQAGVVAHDIVRDCRGNVVIDPRTNEPLRMPLHNSKPVLEAIRFTGGRGVQACAIRRRCAKAAEPDGSGWHPLKVVASMDQKRLEAALAAGLARLRAPPAEVVVDVVPVGRGGGGSR